MNKRNKIILVTLAIGAIIVAPVLMSESYIEQSVQAPTPVYTLASIAEGKPKVGQLVLTRATVFSIEPGLQPPKVFVLTDGGSKLNARLNGNTHILFRDPGREFSFIGAINEDGVFDVSEVLDDKEENPIGVSGKSLLVEALAEGKPTERLIEDTLFHKGIRRREVSDQLHLAAQSAFLAGDNQLANELVRLADIAQYIDKEGVDATDSEGWNVLMASILDQCKMCISYSVRIGTDINHRARDGNTPASVAAYVGNTEIVEMLWDVGVKWCTVDNENVFPWEIWQASNHDKEVGNRLKRACSNKDDVELPSELQAQLSEAMAKDAMQRKIAAEKSRKEKRRRTVKRFSMPSGYTFSDALRSGGDGPEMVVLPQSWYLMGSTAAYERRRLNSGYLKNGPFDVSWRELAQVPAHEVLVYPIAVATHEVTFWQFKRCVDQGGCDRFPKGGKGNLPVVNVTWKEAKAYADWLSRETSKTYRLLSEAEWEFAARAGSDTLFWWGKEPDFYEVCRAAHQYCHGKKVGLFPVGSLKPNSWGIYDMSGNVWEWVEDCAHADYRGAPADSRPWLDEGNTYCSHRIMRGGSWESHPSDIEVRARAAFDRDSRYSQLGFRVAREP